MGAKTESLAGWQCRWQLPVGTLFSFFCPCLIFGLHAIWLRLGLILLTCLGPCLLHRVSPSRYIAARRCFPTNHLIKILLSLTALNLWKWNADCGFFCRWTKHRRRNRRKRRNRMAHKLLASVVTHEAGEAFNQFDGSDDSLSNPSSDDSFNGAMYDSTWRRHKEGTALLKKAPKSDKLKVQTVATSMLDNPKAGPFLAGTAAEWKEKGSFERSSVDWNALVDRQCMVVMEGLPKWTGEAFAKFLRDEFEIELEGDPSESVTISLLPGHMPLTVYTVFMTVTAKFAAVCSGGSDGDDPMQPFTARLAVDKASNKAWLNFGGKDSIRIFKNICGLGGAALGLSRNQAEAKLLRCVNESLQAAGKGDVKAVAVDIAEFAFVDGKRVDTEWYDDDTPVSLCMLDQGHAESLVKDGLLVQFWAGETPMEAATASAFHCAMALSEHQPFIERVEAKDAADKAAVQALKCQGATMVVSISNMRGAMTKTDLAERKLASSRTSPRAALNARMLTCLQSAIPQAGIIGVRISGERKLLDSTVECFVRAQEGATALASEAKKGFNFLGVKLDNPKKLTVSTTLLVKPPKPNAQDAMADAAAAGGGGARQPAQADRARDAAQGAVELCVAKLVSASSVSYTVEALTTAGEVVRTANTGSGNNTMFMTPLDELAAPAVARDHDLLTAVRERLKGSHLHAEAFFGAIHKLHDAGVIVVTSRRQEGVLVIRKGEADFPGVKRRTSPVNPGTAPGGVQGGDPPRPS